MWSAPRATPKRPSPASAKYTRARARPWLVAPPANDVTALTMAAKSAGLAHGVPVWRDWKTKVGTHGAKLRHPSTTATTAARAPCRRRRGPRHAWNASHRPTTATR